MNCDHEVDFTGCTGFALRIPFMDLITLTPLTGRIGLPDASSVKKHKHQNYFLSNHH